MINQTILKTKLEKELKRKAKPNEVKNAEKDVNLLIKVLFEEIEEIKKRLDKVNKK